jgi:hypothetical protein
MACCTLLLFYSAMPAYLQRLLVQSQSHVRLSPAQQRLVVQVTAAGCAVACKYNSGELQESRTQKTVAVSVATSRLLWQQTQFVIRT